MADKVATAGAGRSPKRAQGSEAQGNQAARKALTEEKISQIIALYHQGKSYKEIMAEACIEDVSVIQRAMLRSGTMPNRKPRTTLDEELQIVAVLRKAEAANWSLNRQSLEAERSIGVLLRVAAEHGVEVFKKPLRGKPLKLARERERVAENGT